MARFDAAKQGLRWSTVLLVVVAIAACGRGGSGSVPADVEAPAGGEAPPSSIGADHRNVEYSIDGRAVRLVDGVSEVAAAPGSASRIVTRYFGNEVRRDLNADGRDDVVFLLTQEIGGSGTFYYVVAALSTDGGYVGSAGVLLGDRIAPQTTGFRANDVIVVDYADRRRGESFATPPSVGKSIWLKLDVATRRFGEVARDFEGEADPARMTLSMKTWVWVRAADGAGTEIVPRQADAFTLTFGADGAAAATTDCNRATGGYAVNGRELRFGDLAMTRMFCAGSQEAEFVALLGRTASYRFTSRGELVLSLEDGGSAVFR
jgi:heat shock protein HslJ